MTLIHFNTSGKTIWEPWKADRGYWKVMTSNTFVDNTGFQTTSDVCNPCLDTHVTKIHLLKHYLPPSLLIQTPHGNSRYLGMKTEAPLGDKIHCPGSAGRRLSWRLKAWCTNSYCSSVWIIPPLWKNTPHDYRQQHCHNSST